MYCSVVWHICDVTDTHMMEKIQENTLHSIYDNYESVYVDFLQMASKDSLYFYLFQCVHRAPKAFCSRNF